MVHSAQDPAGQQCDAPRYVTLGPATGSGKGEDSGMPESSSDPYPPEPHPEHESGPPTMVVGVDGPESTIGALRCAAEIAVRLEFRVQALAVWHYDRRVRHARSRDAGRRRRLRR